MALRRMTIFRSGALCVAGIAICYASWTLAAQIAKPVLPFFPVTPQEMQQFTAKRSAAHLAARLGVLRADLWTEYALTLDSGGYSAGTSASSAGYAGTIAAAERSASLGPHDARIWLLLAQVHAKLDGLNRTIVGPLKMSYYTGPNEISLVGPRLSLATQTGAINDPEIQDLATSDLQVALLHRPTGRPLIMSAYATASAAGKKFLESAVSKLDPDFARRLAN